MASNGSNGDQNENELLTANSERSYFRLDTRSRSLNTIGRALLQLVDDQRARRRERRRGRRQQSGDRRENSREQVNQGRTSHSPGPSYIPLIRPQRSSQLNEEDGRQIERGHEVHAVIHHEEREQRERYPTRNRCNEQEGYNVYREEDAGTRRRENVHITNQEDD